MKSSISYNSFYISTTYKCISCCFCCFIMFKLFWKQSIQKHYNKPSWYIFFFYTMLKTYIHVCSLGKMLGALFMCWQRGAPQGGNLIYCGYTYFCCYHVSWFDENLYSLGYLCLWFAKDSMQPYMYTQFALHWKLIYGLPMKSTKKCVIQKIINQQYTKFIAYQILFLYKCTN